MASESVARTTRKGCPNHPIDFKRRLAMQACEAGVSVSKLALEHGLNTNLLFRWRRQYRAGHFGSVDSANTIAAPAVKLLPVITEKLPPKKSTGSSAPVIEIVLGDAIVRLCHGVDAQALHTVFDCLVKRR